MLINLVILIKSNIQKKKIAHLNYELNKLNIKYNNEYRRTLQSEDKRSKKNKRINITPDKNRNKNDNKNIIKVNSNNIFRNDKIIKKNSSYNSVTDTIHHKVDKNVNTDKNNYNKNSELKVVHI